MARWFPSRSVARQRHPFCNNANAAIRRSLWLELPYDENLTGLEDLDWARRALDRGHVLSYVADAPIVHVHDETFGQVVNRYRREAIAHKQIYNEQQMTLRTAVRLGAANLVGDIRAARKRGLLREHLFEIAQFRTAQFYGTYRGFAQQGPVPGLAQAPILLSGGCRRIEPPTPMNPLPPAASSTTTSRCRTSRLESMTDADRRIAAFVPMRHTSERVRGKNYRPLGGRPLFHHIVGALLACPHIDEVVIDTDSELIAADARTAFPDVRIIERPEHLLGGDVPMNDGPAATTSSRSRPTSTCRRTAPTRCCARRRSARPSRRSSHREGRLRLAVHRHAAAHPPLDRRRARRSTTIPTVLLRTQDLPPVMEENSCLYVFDGETLRAARQPDRRAAAAVPAPARGGLGHRRGDRLDRRRGAVRRAARRRMSGTRVLITCPQMQNCIDAVPAPLRRARRSRSTCPRSSSSRARTS